MKAYLVKINIGTIEAIYPVSEGTLECIRRINAEHEIIRELTEEEKETWLDFEKRLYSAWVDMEMEEEEGGEEVCQ